MLFVLLLALSLFGEVFTELLTLLRRLSTDANEPAFGVEGNFSLGQCDELLLGRTSHRS